MVRILRVLLATTLLTTVAVLLPQPAAAQVTDLPAWAQEVNARVPALTDSGSDPVNVLVLSGTTSSRPGLASELEIQLASRGWGDTTASSQKIGGAAQVQSLTRNPENFYCGTVSCRAKLRMWSVPSVAGAPYPVMAHTAIGVANTHWEGGPFHVVDDWNQARRQLANDVYQSRYVTDSYFQRDVRVSRPRCVGDGVPYLAHTDSANLCPNGGVYWDGLRSVIILTDNAVATSPLTTGYSSFRPGLTVPPGGSFTVTAYVDCARCPTGDYFRVYAPGYLGTMRFSRTFTSSSGGPITVESLGYLGSTPYRVTIDVSPRR
jgi:hypothetical protein